MKHYPECPRGEARSRAACTCTVISTVIGNAMGRFNDIDMRAFPTITRHPEFHPLVTTIAGAIRGEGRP